MKPGAQNWIQISSDLVPGTQVLEPLCTVTIGLPYQEVGSDVEPGLSSCHFSVACGLLRAMSTSVPQACPRILFIYCICVHEHIMKIIEGNEMYFSPDLIPICYSLSVRSYCHPRVRHWQNWTFQTTSNTWVGLLRMHYVLWFPSLALQIGKGGCPLSRATIRVPVSQGKMYSSICVTALEF